MNNKSQRYHGFDYLRALMTLAIVAWHIKLFGISDIAKINLYKNHSFIFSDLINYHFLLLGVPVFFLISLFLFSYRILNETGYLTKRLERLSYLYIFWTGFWLIVFKAVYGYSFIRLDSAKKIVLLIITGGHSLYYFLFSLIILTGISFIVSKLRVRYLWPLLIITLLFMIIFPLSLGKNNSFQYFVAYWNPVNFLPYVLISAIVAKYMQKEGIESYYPEMKKCILLLFILLIVSSFLEWKYFVNVNNFKYDAQAIPSYTRVSVVIGSTIFFLSSFFIRKPPNRIIRFLSEYSLGIYLTHGFIILVYTELINPKTNYLNHFEWRLILFLVVIQISLAGSAILRRMFRSGLI